MVNLTTLTAHACMYVHLRIQSDLLLFYLTPPTLNKHAMCSCEFTINSSYKIRILAIDSQHDIVWYTNMIVMSCIIIMFKTWV